MGRYPRNGSLTELVEARDKYLKSLADEYDLHVIDVSRIYNGIKADGLIDYDTEKEVLLDE